MIIRKHTNRVLRNPIEYEQCVYVSENACARDKNTLHIIIIIIHQLCVKAVLHNGRVPAIRILVELNNK